MVAFTNLFDNDPGTGPVNIKGSLQVGQFTPNGLEINFAGELPPRLQANYAVQGVAFQNDSPNERGQHAYNFLLAQGVAPSVNHVLHVIAQGNALEKAGFAGPPSDIQYDPTHVVSSHAAPDRTPLSAIEQARSQSARRAT